MQALPIKAMSADQMFLWGAVFGAAIVLFSPRTSADALVPPQKSRLHEDVQRINNCVHTKVGRRELAFCMLKTFAVQSLILFLPSRVHKVLSNASWFVSTLACEHSDINHVVIQIARCSCVHHGLV